MADVLCVDGDHLVGADGVAPLGAIGDRRPHEDHRRLAHEFLLQRGLGDLFRKIGILTQEGELMLPGGDTDRTRG